MIRCLSLFSCLVAIGLCVLNVTGVLREGIKHFVGKELKCYDDAYDAS